jgi:hypothetical protein
MDPHGIGNKNMSSNTDTLLVVSRNVSSPVHIPEWYKMKERRHKSNNGVSTV